MSFSEWINSFSNFIKVMNELLVEGLDKESYVSIHLCKLV